MANKVCTNCQKEIPSGSKFCANCGSKIGGGKSSSAKSHSKEIIIVVVILAVVCVGYFSLRDKPEPVISQETTEISGHANVEGAGQSMNILGSLPDNYDALVGMGNQFMDEGNFPVGAECYKRALAIKPDSPDVRVDYGACLHGMGLPQRALEEFQEVISNYPGHEIVHFNMGIVFNELQMTDSAVTYWKKYLELEPDGSAAQSAAQLIEQYGGK